MKTYYVIFIIFFHTVQNLSSFIPHGELVTSVSFYHILVEQWFLRDPGSWRPPELESFQKNLPPQTVSLLILGSTWRSRNVGWNASKAEFSRLHVQALRWGTGHWDGISMCSATHKGKTHQHHFHETPKYRQHHRETGKLPLSSPKITKNILKVGKVC